MGSPQGGKLPCYGHVPQDLGGFGSQVGSSSAEMQARAFNQMLAPLRPSRCRYCGSMHSEHSLRNAKCENCGATL